MSEFIRNNAVYVVAVIALIFGYLIGKSRGKLEAMSMIATQQMRIEAERAHQQMMADMMRGFNHGN